jgi:spore germination protein YaaH
MIRRFLTLAAVGAGTALLGAAPGAHAASCTTTKALAPSAVRVGDGTSAVVRWRVPKHHPSRLAYRVARDGAVIGQTVRSKMRIRVSPTAATRITVTAIVGGSRTRCHVTVRLHARAGSGPVAAGLKAPGAVAARPAGAARVRIGWARTAGARGYRLLRDGRATRRRTRGRAFIVKAVRRPHRFQVAAVDGAGRLGPRSGTIVVRRGHAAPSAPGAPAASRVTDSSATLSWSASHGRIASYRILRRGAVVRAVRGRRVTLRKLASLHSQTFRVVAIDRAGYASRASAPVTVRTGHTAPGAPGAPRATALTDSTVSLAWAPGTLPASSKLRGYRVMRDGKVIAQVSVAQASAGSLAPKSAHDWTVAAVDTLGYVSAPSPATRIVQRDPSPTAGGVQSFLLASTDSSFAAFRKHYNRIGVIYPTFFDCSGTNRIEGANNQQIVTYAQDRRVRVLPRFNCQNTARLHQILADAKVRAYWLSNITALAERFGWDGVNLDFEAVDAADRDLLTSFVAELSRRLHANGKLMSQAVSAKTDDTANHPRSSAFDYKALAASNDYVFVMAWGLHWATSAPGPQDDYPWVKQVRDYVATMPHQEKFVMGTMLYGMDWPAGGGTAHPATALHFAEIQALIAREGGAPQYVADKHSWRYRYTDAAGVPHDVWYSDARAVGDRVALARERGLKVGFWRVGQEDERIWTDPRLPVGG